MPLFVAPAQAAWDTHRNTSKTHPVPPDALRNALHATRQFRRTAPAHWKWIVDGHPTLTEAEHVERFGEPYKGAR